MYCKYTLKLNRRVSITLRPSMLQFSQFVTNTERKSQFTPGALQGIPVNYGHREMKQICHNQDSITVSKKLHKGLGVIKTTCVIQCDTSSQKSHLEHKKYLKKDSWTQAQ